MTGNAAITAAHGNAIPVSARSGSPGSLVEVVPMPERLATLLDHARPTAASSGWYRITNADGGDNDEATLMIYADIGGFFGIDAADFAAALAEVTAKRIMVRLNSPGGAVDQGLAIGNLLRSHSAYVTVSVDGMAASIASVIAMAGDDIIMQPQSQMMVHRAFGLCVGNTNDMKKMVDVLERQDVNIAKAYAARAGGRYDTWLNRMDAETWFTAEEAVAAGLADRVATYPRKKDAPEEGQRGKPAEEELEEPEMATAAKWDLSVFRYAGRDAAPAPDLADGPANASEQGPEPTSCPPARAERTGTEPAGTPRRAGAGAGAGADPAGALRETASRPMPLMPAGAAPGPVATGALHPDVVDQLRAAVRDEFRAAGIGAAEPADTAVGPHETAVEEGAWDAGVQEKRLPSPMPVATARRVYAWYDASRAEDGKIAKAYCKLPHHFVGDDGTPGAASANGVRNALARLDQTQGPSDAERDTIRRHLRGHLPGSDGGEDQADTPGEDTAASPEGLAETVAAFLRDNPGHDVVRGFLATCGTEHELAPDPWADAVAHLTGTPADGWADAVSHLVKEA